MVKLNNYMHIALEEASKAFKNNEVPVGAVIISADGKLIAKAHNCVITNDDATAHAEILVIKKACKKLQQSRLDGCDLYVTLEPCTMCAGAIAHAKIRRLYFGAYDEKGGAIESGIRFFSQKTCHHAPEVYGGINEENAKSLLKSFFKDKR